MKIKVIRKIPPEEIKPKSKLFLIEDELLWHCKKCKLLYGKGETILENNDGKFCPIHKKKHVYSADIDYWRREYELGKWI